MKNTLTCWASLVALGAWLGVCCPGCSRESSKNTYPQRLEAASKLPGATNIFAALDRKDYEGALGACAKLKESLSTEQEQIDFVVFAAEVKTRLARAATTDPKAAEALQALRAFTAAR